MWPTPSCWVAGRACYHRPRVEPLGISNSAPPNQGTSLRYCAEMHTFTSGRGVHCRKVFLPAWLENSPCEGHDASGRFGPRFALLLPTCLRAWSAKPHAQTDNQTNQKLSGFPRPPARSYVLDSADRNEIRPNPPHPLSTSLFSRLT